MGENTKTEKKATEQSSPNKSATPLIVPPSEIKVVTPKMVARTKSFDSTLELETFGGMTSANDERKK